MLSPEAEGEKSKLTWLPQIALTWNSIKGDSEANLLRNCTNETLSCQNAVKSCQASRLFIPRDTCQNNGPAIWHSHDHMRKKIVYLAYTATVVLFLTFCVMTDFPSKSEGLGMCVSIPYTFLINGCLFGENIIFLEYKF